MYEINVRNDINKFKSEKIVVIVLINRKTKQVKVISIPNIDKENFCQKSVVMLKSN